MVVDVFRPVGSTVAQRQRRWWLLGVERNLKTIVVGGGGGGGGGGVPVHLHLVLQLLLPGAF